MSDVHTIDSKFFLETSLHTHSAEIAELAHGGALNGRKGLPRRIHVPGLGNGQPFIATSVERNEGDLMFVEYTQIMGCSKLIIFND